MAATSAAPRAWTWAGGYIALTVLAPFLYLVWLLHRGLVADLDVQRREQRMRPLIFTLACGALAWLGLAMGRAPWPMVVLAGQLWLQTLLIFGITLYWKISVHCTTAAAVATLTWSLFGTPLPLLIGVPLIAWSRVRQHRHTLAQTVAGSLLGIAMTLVALSLMAGR
jgi:membrane-associated phospholipid phosphatase